MQWLLGLTCFPDSTARPPARTDILGRILAQKLTERLGPQVVVDNRPGASAIIGSELLARFAPDGYTIMTANIAHGANPYLVKKLPYDTANDFAPVTLMALLPSVLVIHPSLPARTVKEFVSLAKARPGSLTYGTAGSGSANHLTLADVRERTSGLGADVKGGTAAEFGEFIRRELRLWEKVVRQANLRAD